MAAIIIVLEVINVSHKERILLRCPYSSKIVSIIRKLPDAKYSAGFRAWHIPMLREVLTLLQHKLEGFAEINFEHLREHLEAKRTMSTMAKEHTSSPMLQDLSQENRDAYQQFIEYLLLKAYSQSTIRTYRNEFLQLLKLLKHHPVSNLSPDDIRRYMLYCVKENNLSEATLNSRINAIKCYFEQVLHREQTFIELPRPKMPLTLPKVLGENELGRLFNALGNLKHKAILFTAYSAGLRVSEVVHLQLKHVDSDRMQLLIQAAKGKKDRYVGLSPIVLDILRRYIKTCPTKPLKYVFEGTVPGTPYSTRSAQEVFRMAKRSAKISKDVTFHSLRHSFATHLLEKGVSVIYIRDILGHFNIKTTERYLHVRKEELVMIVSPLDDLWNKGGLKF